MGVLPLINGVFDFVSYAVTLTFLRLGGGGAWRAVVWALADLAVAGILFLALGCTLIAVTHQMNQVAGVDFVPFQTLFADLGDWRAYPWLYAMVFSTMLPTLAHFVLALAGTLRGAPEWVRDRMAGLIGAAAHTPRAMIGAPFFMTVLSLVWLGLILPFLLVPLQLAGSDAIPTAPGLAAAARWYLSLFEDFAVWIGALPG